MAALALTIVAALLIASTQSQIMFTPFSQDGVPTMQMQQNVVPSQSQLPADAGTLQINNVSDAPLPNLGQLLMNLITLAKQLSVNTPDSSQSMSPPWNPSQQMGPGGEMPGHFNIQMGTPNNQVQMGTPNNHPMFQHMAMGGGMPFGGKEHLMGLMMGSGMMGPWSHQRNQQDSDEESHGGRPFRPSFGPHDSQDDEGRGGRSHGRPIPRPYGPGGEDEGRGGRPPFPPHGRPMPRPDWEDREDKRSPRHGRDEPQDDDEEDFSRFDFDFDFDDEDEGENDMEERGKHRPSHHGGGGHGGGGKGHKKPKCKDVVKFLLRKLREKCGHRGGRGGGGHGGRGGRGEHGGRGEEDNFNKEHGMMMMQGRGGSEKVDDSNDNMIFPRRLPFPFGDMDYDE